MGFKIQLIFERKIIKRQGPKIGGKYFKKLKNNYYFSTDFSKILEIGTFLSHFLCALKMSLPSKAL